MPHLPADAALLLIDIQAAWDQPSWGAFNNPHVDDNNARLLDGWRATGRPVIHVQHDSRKATSLFHPSSSGNAMKAFIQPRADEPVVRKSVNSAFIGTDLEAALRRRRIGTLVMVGYVTDHCVSTTARMAGNLGFATYVVSDATATYDRVGPDGRSYSAAEIHAVSLASLHEEFATVGNTETLLTSIDSGAAVAR
jgi:nicotinamidase-related amidase